MSEHAAKILAQAIESALVTDKVHRLPLCQSPNNLTDAVLEVARAITRLAVAVEQLAARND